MTEHEGPARSPEGGEPAARGLDRLTAAVARILDTGGDVETVTAAVAGAVAEVTRGEDLLPLFADRDRSFAAYVDPERHFLVHCSVHRPGHVTEAHDHGEAWAVYGVVRGRSRYRRFRREPDAAPGTATLVCERDAELRAGETDVVRPGEVHLVANETEEPAWNVVVRPRPVQEVWRRRYDLGSGAYRIHPNSRASGGRADARASSPTDGAVPPSPSPAPPSTREEGGAR